MTEATSRPISRRTVAKGAAWTAPVILGGAAAPAYASSPSLPPVFPELAVKGTCKHASNDVYHVGVVWKNTQTCIPPKGTTVKVTSIVAIPNSGTGIDFLGLPHQFDVAAGSTANAVYHSEPAPNMANGDATITYTYTDCDGIEQLGQVPLYVDSLKSCPAIGVPKYPA